MTSADRDRTSSASPTTQQVGRRLPHPRQLRLGRRRRRAHQRPRPGAHRLVLAAALRRRLLRGDRRRIWCWSARRQSPPRRASRLRINQAAYCIHAPIHDARPDVVAVVHTHTGYGTPFAALVPPLRAISQEACAFHADQAVFDGEELDVLDPVVGRRLARGAGGQPAAGPGQPRAADRRAPRSGRRSASSSSPSVPPRSRSRSAHGRGDQRRRSRAGLRLGRRAVERRRGLRLADPIAAALLIELTRRSRAR